MQSLGIMLFGGFIILLVLFGGCWALGRITDIFLDKDLPGGYFKRDK